MNKELISLIYLIFFVQVVQMFFFAILWNDGRILLDHLKEFKNEGDRRKWLT